jgi:hypothetical protein
MNPLQDAVALQRYHRANIVPQSRRSVISSWIENDTYSLTGFNRGNFRILDLLVHSYNPQPNLLRCTFSSADLLPSFTAPRLASLSDKLNQWDFHAGNLSDDELIWCAVLILEHVLGTGGQDLLPYKISRGSFLVVCPVLT